MRPAVLSAVTAALCLWLTVALALADPAAKELRRAGEFTVATVGLVVPPSAELVRTRTLEWVAQRVGADKARLEEIGKRWAWATRFPQPRPFLN